MFRIIIIQLFNVGNFWELLIIKKIIIKFKEIPKEKLFEKKWKYYI